MGNWLATPIEELGYCGFDNKGVLLEAGKSTFVS
jgi:hypothetical protein